MLASQILKINKTEELRSVEGEPALAQKGFSQLQNEQDYNATWRFIAKSRTL